MWINVLHVVLWLKTMACASLDGLIYDNAEKSLYGAVEVNVQHLNRECF